MGWYYYLEKKLAFPFKAKCVAERSVSPLMRGEEVEVLGLAKQGIDDCDGWWTAHPTPARPWRIGTIGLP